MAKNRGKYYVNATLIAADGSGKRFGYQVARQVKTRAAARDALDNFKSDGSAEFGFLAGKVFIGRGYVQRWSDETQSRSIVAERDEAGNWWASDPFTGNLVAI